MKSYLYDLLKYQGDLTWQQIFSNVGFSAVLGFVIFLSYFFSHRGTLYSKKFNVTLVALTVMTGTVMTVIGNNIAAPPSRTLGTRSTSSGPSSQASAAA